MAVEKFMVFLLVCVTGPFINVAKAAASAIDDDIKTCLRVGPNIDVSLSDLDDGWHQQSQTGVVNGHRSCGGPGRVLQMRYATCSGDPDSICRVPADDVTRPAELYFIPSQDVLAVGVRIIVSTRGIPPTVVFEKVLENSELYKGEKYSMSAEVGASPMFKGRQISLRFELYDASRNQQAAEICSEAEFLIV